MRLHWWHDWSEWTDVTKTTTWTEAGTRTQREREHSSTEVDGQERRCRVCGLLEREKLYGRYSY